jgi:ABC-type transport system substrate-binding protein
MKTRVSLAFLLGVLLLLALAWSAGALRGTAAAAPSGPDSYWNPLTVNVYLGNGDVPTLDPAYASNTMSWNAVEQLFIGLVDVDDDTSDIVPELAIRSLPAMYGTGSCERWSLSPAPTTLPSFISSRTPKATTTAPSPTRTR